MNHRSLPIPCAGLHSCTLVSPAHAPLWGVWFSSALSTLLPSHAHDCPELNLVMSGSMMYRVEGHNPNLEASIGDLIVLPSNREHEVIRSSEDLTLWVFELNGTSGLEWLERPGVFASSSAWRKAFVTATRGLWLRPPADEARNLQADLWQALLVFEESSSGPAPGAVHPAVTRARKVCETFVDRELDIADLARQSGSSASRLAHLFADQVGITPLQYRNFARVQHFIRGYDNDERNLLRAALRAGFGSYAQFHRVFLQVCGKTPAAHFRWLSDSDDLDAQRTLGKTVEATSLGAAPPADSFDWLRGNRR